LKTKAAETKKPKPAMPSRSKRKGAKKADSQLVDYRSKTADETVEAAANALANAPKPLWSPKSFALPSGWDKAEIAGAMFNPAMPPEVKFEGFDGWQWLKDFAGINADAELVYLINSVHIHRRSEKNRYPLRSISEIASLTQMLADHDTYQEVHGPVLVNGGGKIADGIHREIAATLIRRKHNPNFKCRGRKVTNDSELESLLAERENRRASKVSITAMNAALTLVKEGKSKGRGKHKDGSFNEALRRFGFSRQTLSGALTVAKAKEAPFLAASIFDGVLSVKQAAAIVEHKLAEAKGLNTNPDQPPAPSKMKQLAREALKTPEPKPKGGGSDGAGGAENTKGNGGKEMSNWPKDTRATTKALRNVEKWIGDCEAMSVQQVQGMVRDWLNGIHDFAARFPHWAELDVNEAWQQLAHLMEQKR